MGDRRAERVVLGGRLRHPCQQRRLRQIQLRDGFVEEDLGGCADAVRRLPADRSVGDVIQVLVEDPVLVVGLLQLLGELGLDDLVLEVALMVGEVQLVGQLHRQRRGALERGAAVEDVPDRRPQDALVVKGPVLIEAAVLDRHRGVLQGGRDLGARYRRPQQGRVDEAQRRTVGREDL